MNTTNNIQNTTIKPQASKSDGPSPPWPVSGGGGAGAQACAACKHQRRRCAPNCLLAPYFPANKQKEFLNVHKHFGVGNVVKTLKNVDPNNRRNSMASVIFEANMRAIDPVGGCCRFIRDLEKRIQFYTSELDSVLKQIAFHRWLNGKRVNSDVCDQDLVNVEVPEEQFLNGKVAENIKPDVEKE
ncbi:hypothetical protein CDL12_20598 [Handroanthus impetiginosus]|uniref:LOB domain-containing protein n=1 Tax=Handroanthus impetiginosus TaxID=429701 RepID=A0A2G9GNE8_9LAMI|nr:hypothetical protein CDL12_20598 [Handroanthus impetiginosus]